MSCCYVPGKYLLILHLYQYSDVSGKYLLIAALIFFLLLSACDRCIPSLVVLRRRVVLMAAATRVEGLHALKGRGRLRLLRQLGRQSRLGCRRSCWRLQGEQPHFTFIVEDGRQNGRGRGESFFGPLVFLQHTLMPNLISCLLYTQDLYKT